MNQRQKIQEEINRQYTEFEKKVKPLRSKLKEEDRNNLLKVLSKHKGIIYRSNYGKGYCVLKVLKSLTKLGRLKYVRITIEEAEDYSINYIKGRKIVSKAEMMKLIKESLKGESK